MKNQQKQTDENNAPSKPSWRIRIGICVFFVPLIFWLVVPVAVALMGFSGAQTKAIIVGTLIAGEVIGFASIPLLGIKGFKAMKSKFFGFLTLKVGYISRRRHIAGVTLLISSIAIQILLTFSILTAYFILGAKGPSALVLGLTFEQQETIYMVVVIVSIVGVMTGVYMLGANFLERLKKAFEWQGGQD